MNRQQKLLLEMIKEIHRICVDNGITYYIGMGTLIGAVRNRGFLPWDDDADVLMPYDEFVKFKEVCKTALPANRYLGSPDTEEEYGHVVPRYISRETTCIHMHQSISDDVAGQVIDIFVLDPIADGEGVYDDYIQDFYQYSAVVNYANAAGDRFEIDPETFKRNMDLVRSKGRLEVVSMLERKMASHFDAEGSRYVYRWQGVPICYERSWFSETVPLPFEDTVLMAPKGINEFLTCYYGENWFDIPDYITPAKHNTAASLDFPYTEALEYFKPTFDREVLRADSERWRYIRFEKAKDEHIWKDGVAEARASLVAMETMALIGEREDEFVHAVAEDDGETLAELLKGYLAWQTSADVIGRHYNRKMYRCAFPVLADVPDYVFEAGLVALLLTDRINYTSRLLEVARQKGLEDTPRMKKLREAIAAFRSSASDYQYGNHREGLATAMELVEDGELPRAAAFLRLACAHAAKLFEQAGDEASESSFESLVERGRSLYPADGVFAKFEADLLFARGEENRARELYLRAAESTRNGLALRDIADQTGYHPSWLRKPAWAKGAGIPPWHGEAPEPLSSAMPQPEAAKPSSAVDRNQEYLLELMSEVAAFCESRGIGYVLAPDAVYSIVRQGRAPDSLPRYSLIVEPDGFLEIYRALGDSLPESRKLRLGANGPSGDSFSLRYCGLDSTYVNLRKKPKDDSCLYVSIYPLEADEGSERFEKEPGPSWAARRLLRVKEAFHRGYTTFNETRMHAGVARDANVARAMRLSSRSHGKKVNLGKEGFPFDTAFIADRREVSIAGHAFSAPADVDAYIQAFPHKQSEKGLTVPNGYLCSASVPATELIAAGAIPEQLPRVYSSLKKRRRSCTEAHRDFQRNFAQIKLAVQLKQVALQLLPIKGEVLEAADRGDTEYLSKTLRGYLQVADSFDGVGDLCFDADLHRIMSELRASR